MIGADKRHHPRVFFPADGGVTGHFERPGQTPDKFPAVIMNMSQGGIGIATREAFSGELSKGDPVLLSFVKVKDATTPIRGVQCVVQWVLEEPASDRLVLGLEFDAVEPLMQRVIKNFVESKLG